MSNRPTRRRLLALVGTSAAAGLAGCPGGALDDIGGGDGSDGGGEGGSDGRGEAADGDGESGGNEAVPTTAGADAGRAIDTSTATPTAAAPTGASTATGGGSDWADLPPLEVPDSAPAGDADACGALLNAPFARYDESETPFVATFEHPAGEVGSVVATASTGEDHSLTIRLQVDGEPLDTFPTMDFEGTAQLTAAERGELDGLETVGRIDYAGETLPVVRAEAGSNGDDGATLYTEYPYYVVGIPHEGSEGKRYHRYDFRATVQFAQNLETGVCRATWEGVAKRMVASLEPNPDTTIGSR